MRNECNSSFRGLWEESADLIILPSLFLQTINAESGIRLKTDVLELAASENSLNISEWRLKTNDKTAEWVSLITNDYHGKVLSHHLAIEGIDFSSQVHHRLSDIHGWSTRAISKDGNIELEKIITPTDVDYRLLCRITIRHLSNETTVLPEKLKVLLGPGLGEYPSNKFGIAEKMLQLFAEFIDGADFNRGVFLQHQACFLEEVLHRGSEDYGFAEMRRLEQVMSAVGYERAAHDHQACVRKPVVEFTDGVQQVDFGGLGDRIIPAAHRD